MNDVIHELESVDLYVSDGPEEAVLLIR